MTHPILQKYGIVEDEPANNFQNKSWESIAKTNPDIQNWYSTLPESKDGVGIVDFMRKQKEQGIYDYQKAIESGDVPKKVSYDIYPHWNDIGKLKNNPNLHNQNDKVHPILAKYGITEPAETPEPQGLAGNVPEPQLSWTAPSTPKQPEIGVPLPEYLQGESYSPDVFDYQVGQTANQLLQGRDREPTRGEILKKTYEVGHIIPETIKKGWSEASNLFPDLESGSFIKNMIVNGLKNTIPELAAEYTAMSATPEVLATGKAISIAKPYLAKFIPILGKEITFFSRSKTLDKLLRQASEIVREEGVRRGWSGNKIANEETKMVQATIKHLQEINPDLKKIPLKTLRKGTKYLKSVKDIYAKSGTGESPINPAKPGQAKIPRLLTNQPEVQAVNPAEQSLIDVPKQPINAQYARLEQQAIQDGMTQPEARLFALDHMKQPQAPKPEIPAPAQQEFGVDGVQSFGKGAEGEADMFDHPVLEKYGIKPEPAQGELTEDEVIAKLKVQNDIIMNALRDLREGKITNDKYLDISRTAKEEKLRISEPKTVQNAPQRTETPQISTIVPEEGVSTTKESARKRKVSNKPDVQSYYEQALEGIPDDIVNDIDVKGVRIVEFPDEYAGEGGRLHVDGKGNHFAFVDKAEDDIVGILRHELIHSYVLKHPEYADNDYFGQERGVDRVLAKAKKDPSDLAPEDRLAEIAKGNPAEERVKDARKKLNKKGLRHLWDVAGVQKKAKPEPLTAEDRKYIPEARRLRAEALKEYDEWRKNDWLTNLPGRVSIPAMIENGFGGEIKALQETMPKEAFWNAFKKDYDPDAMPDSMYSMDTQEFLNRAYGSKHMKKPSTKVRDYIPEAKDREVNPQDYGPSMVSEKKSGFGRRGVSSAYVPLEQSDKDFIREANKRIKEIDKIPGSASNEDLVQERRVLSLNRAYIRKGHTSGRAAGREIQEHYDGVTSGVVDKTKFKIQQMPDKTYHVAPFPVEFAGKKIAHSNLLQVPVGYKGRGIGAKALARIEEKAALDGAEYFAWTNVLPEAQEFYQKNGYILDGGPHGIAYKKLSAQRLDKPGGESYTVKEGKSDYYEQDLFDQAGKTDTGYAPERSGGIQNSPLKLKYKQTGTIKIPQAKISSPADVAFMFQELKNEPVEHTYVVGVKDNAIVSVEPITIGLVDSASMDVYEPLDLLLSKEADTFYFTHNHPSGAIEPSPNDMRIIGGLADAYKPHGIKHGGSIIIDHTKFGFVDKNMSYSAIEHKQFQAGELKDTPVYKKYVEWSKSIDEAIQLRSTGDMFQLIKGLTADWSNNAFVVYLNNQNKIVGTEFMPNKNLRTKDIIKSAVGVRGTRVIMANSKLSISNLNALNKTLQAYRIDLLDDIYPDKANAGVQFRSAATMGLIVRENKARFSSEPALPGTDSTFGLKKTPDNKTPFDTTGTSGTQDKMLDVTPNLPPPFKMRGGITSPEGIDPTTWKDKWKMSLNRETFERNIEDVAPKEDAEAVKKSIVYPTRRNETLRTKFANKLRDEARAVANETGIKRNSIEDAMVMVYGEKKITLDELKAALPKTWDSVVSAEKFFRQKYDELLDKWNYARARYGYKPVPKRKDYFRHFDEIDNIFKEFGFILRQEDIPTSISGMTEFFQPGKPFSTAELRRRGVRTKLSALGGMDNYIDSVTRQIYHIDSVQRIRALENYLREVDVALRKDGGSLNLPSLVANLKEYGNLVAGKKSAVDRAFESLFGRQFYGVMAWMSRKAGANMILGNIRSALSNFIPYTQTIATSSKLAVLRGSLDAALSPFKADPNLVDGQESGFLIRRYPEQVIKPNFWKKTENVLAFLFESVDKYMARAIINTKYRELVKKGYDKKVALKEASDYVGRIVTDRSWGQLPNLMGIRSARILTMFQTEINNMYSNLTKDFPKWSEGKKLKLLSSAIQFMIYSFLLNEGFKKFTGRRASLDPIHMAMTLLGLNEEGKSRKPGDKILYTSRELMDNLPFVGNIIGGRFPMFAGMPSLTGMVKNPKSMPKELSKAAIYYGLPGAGGQIKKMVEGLAAFGRGYTKTPSGRVRYPVGGSIASLIQNAIFGQYAGKEAQDYWDKNRRPLGSNQSEKFIKTPFSERNELYDMVMSQRPGEKAEQRITPERKQRLKEREKKVKLREKERGRSR